jgi:predicted P-loop ATPase
LDYELSELAGLRRTEIETVKSFLSKTADNARPAYGRFRVDQPRRVVFVGTTNDSEYLRDATGNRRFWPVRTSIIDLDALRRDRDQLWAEAVAADSRGEALTLANDLYEAAAQQQEERLVKDAWDDMLAGVKGEFTDADGVERISSEKLLRVHLGLSPDKIHDGTTKRLRNSMHRLGWSGPKKMRFEANREHDAKGNTSIPKQGYWRPSRTA